jgi:cell division protein FtsW
MSRIRDAFLATVMMLLSLGLIMVVSASVTSRPSETDERYLLRHLMFLVVAVAAGAVAAAVPPRFWQRAAPWCFAGTIALLVLVLIPGIGREVNGARRWLRCGSISLQPSEIAKVTLPLYLCWVVERRRLRSGRIEGIAPPLVPIALTAFLVLQQPDLGTSIFLCTTAMLCLLLTGWPLFPFVLAGGLVVPPAAGLLALRPYQQERIEGFLAAWRDLDAAPYQIQQSLTTLGVGRWLGVGLGRGTQKLSFLPEANTDFVFAVIGEELGLVGTLAVIGLWLSFFALGLRLLRRVPPHSFAYAAAVTLLTQLVLQAAINVAVVTSLLPAKGIPHPLISYGGSSLVMSLVAVGIVLSLARERRSQRPTLPLHRLSGDTAEEAGAPAALRHRDVRLCPETVAC